MSANILSFSRLSMIPKTQSLLFILLIPLLLFSIVLAAEAKRSHHHEKKRDMRLFVFGDSYVDTGNFVHSASYKLPNGITFPGKPSGRFCDGRVITDYIASFLGIRTPMAYAYRNVVDKSKLKNGMNYAYGGTGIFNTIYGGPNFTIQINSLQEQIQHNVYTKHDLRSSVAFINIGGNDYSTFLHRNGTLKDIGAFSTVLVNKLCLDLKRIESVGVKKVAIALMMPMGCVPEQSINTSYKSCAPTPNFVAKKHNEKLLHCLANLNSQSSSSSSSPNNKPAFVAVDLYNTFISVLTSMQTKHSKDPRLINPLEPCVTVKMDKEGQHIIVCKEPEKSFYWDQAHPTQNGWQEVYRILKSSLHQLLPHQT